MIGQVNALSIVIDESRPQRGIYQSSYTTAHKSRGVCSFFLHMAARTRLLEREIRVYIKQRRPAVVDIEIQGEYDRVIPIHVMYNVYTSYSYIYTGAGDLGYFQRLDG